MAASAPRFSRVRRARWRKGISQLGIHAASRVHCDGERVDVALFTPAHHKEISERTLYRRILLAIPGGSQDEPAPVVRSGRDPDVLNSTRPMNIGQRKCALWGNGDGGRDFPAYSKVACTTYSCAFGCHASLPFLASEILCANRARPRPREARQIA